MNFSCSAALKRHNHGIKYVGRWKDDLNSTVGWISENCPGYAAQKVVLYDGETLYGSSSYTDDVIATEEIWEDIECFSGITKHALWDEIETSLANTEHLWDDSFVNQLHELLQRQHMGFSLKCDWLPPQCLVSSIRNIWLQRLLGYSDQLLCWVWKRGLIWTNGVIAIFKLIKISPCFHLLTGLF